MKTLASSSSCAICAALVIEDPPIREPLGKNGALVVVCEACRTETPIARQTERGYDGGTGPSLSDQEVISALRKKFGEAEYDRVSKKNTRDGQRPSRARTQGERDWKAHVYETYRRDRTGSNDHPTSPRVGRKWRPDQK